MRGEQDESHRTASLCEYRRKRWRDLAVIQDVVIRQEQTTTLEKRVLCDAIGGVRGVRGVGGVGGVDGVDSVGSDDCLLYHGRFVRLDASLYACYDVAAPTQFAR